ncbi:MAG: hypothetical protein QW478_04690 [Candidatus Micrarchaeaceae archaeon]
MKIKKKKVYTLISVIAVLLFFSALLAIGISYLLLPPPPTTYTETYNINSGSRILAINITFSNYTINWLSKAIIYHSYKINSASEELPNGTIIMPATSYTDEQARIFICSNDYLGNPDAWLYFAQIKCD